MKTQKKVLVLLLVFALALSVAACGGSGGGSSSDLVGTWSVTGGTYFGLDDEGVPEGMSITFEFKKDGGFALTVSLFGESETAEGTWTVSGSKVTMTVDDDPLTTSYTISGNTLNMTVVDTSASEDGETLVFTKK